MSIADLATSVSKFVSLGIIAYGNIIRDGNVLSLQVVLINLWCIQVLEKHGSYELSQTPDVSIPFGGSSSISSLLSEKCLENGSSLPRGPRDLLLRSGARCKI